jgi:hypothetical protein
VIAFADPAPPFVHDIDAVPRPSATAGNAVKGIAHGVEIVGELKKSLPALFDALAQSATNWIVEPPHLKPRHCRKVAHCVEPELRADIVALGARSCISIARNRVRSVASIALSSASTVRAGPACIDLLPLVVVLGYVAICIFPHLRRHKRRIFFDYELAIRGRKVWVTCLAVSSSPRLRK